VQATINIILFVLILAKRQQSIKDAFEFGSVLQNCVHHFLLETVIAAFTLVLFLLDIVLSRDDFVNESHKSALQQLFINLCGYSFLLIYWGEKPTRQGSVMENTSQFARVCAVAVMHLIFTLAILRTSFLFMASNTDEAAGKTLYASVYVEAILLFQLAHAVVRALVICIDYTKPQVEVCKSLYDLLSKHGKFKRIIQRAGPTDNLRLNWEALEHDVTDFYSVTYQQPRTAEEAARDRKLIYAEMASACLFYFSEITIWCLRTWKYSKDNVPCLAVQTSINALVLLARLVLSQFSKRMEFDHNAIPALVPWIVMVCCLLLQDSGYSHYQLAIDFCGYGFVLLFWGFRDNGAGDVNNSNNDLRMNFKIVSFGFHLAFSGLLFGVNVDKESGNTFAASGVNYIYGLFEIILLVQLAQLAASSIGMK
jgi:hypothetical protein